jgi:hypothetical protein
MEGTMNPDEGSCHMTLYASDREAGHVRDLLARQAVHAVREKDLPLAAGQAFDSVLEALPEFRVR